MLDVIAIQQTLNRYSEGASRTDWEQMMSTFMVDGIWEIPALGVRYQGHAAIRKAMVGFAAPMAYLVQNNAPGVITVDRDKATARSVIRECGKFTERDAALEILGIYNDEMVRTSGGWKFTRRTFQVAGMHSFPLLPAPSSI